MSLKSFACVISQGQKQEEQKKKKQGDGKPVVGTGAKGGASSPDHPVSHWRSRLTLNIVGDQFLFDRDYLPSDVHRYLRV